MQRNRGKQQNGKERDLKKIGDIKGIFHANRNDRRAGIVILYSWKRNAKNKVAVWGGLTNSCEKRRSEKQRRKGKI